MVFPTLPLPARTEVNVESQFTPNIFESNDGYVERKSKDYRRIPKSSVSFSTYLDNITTITDFLHERSGYKPFILLQNNLSYICPKWTITYTTGNKGTIQLQLTRYTN